MRAKLYSVTRSLSGGFRLWLATLATALLLVSSAQAQAPANDNCAGAIALPVGVTCAVTTGTNVNATASGLPAPSCGSTATRASNDVWYSLVVPAGGGFTVTTSEMSGSLFNDTVLELYAGTCGSFISLGCNDDNVESSDGFSSVTVTGQTAGSTVYVRVYGYDDASTPTGQFNICATLPAPIPTNDECAGAVALTPGTTCTAALTTNRSATASTGVPTPKPMQDSGCFVPNTPVNNDVWYSIVVPATGAVSVTTSAVAGSLLDDTGLTLYTGTCGSLTEVACSDDIVSGSELFSSARVVGLTPGSTLYARVWSFGATPTGQFNICAVVIPTNDAAIQTIYALGKVPTSNSQTVQARVTNTGATALVNVLVQLTVSGATTFTDAKIIASLATGASTTVSFGSFPSNTIGTNTLTVTLGADNIASNNTLTYSQIVTSNTFSYANNTPLDPNLSVGFGPTATGACVVRYNAAASRTLTGITAAITDRNTAGQTLYGVVVSSTGTVLARTPDYVVAAADIDQRKNFQLTTPLILAAGDFYVGVVQTPTTATGQRYFPISTLPQTPTQPNTFFVVAPFSPTSGGTPVDVTTIDASFGIFVIEAVTNIVQGTSAALNRAINLYPNPSNGQVLLDISNAKARGAMQVQVINMLGQVVHTATVRDNAQNKLDLSGLANGLYSMRVSSGAEYTLRQLVLTK